MAIRVNAEYAADLSTNRRAFVRVRIERTGQAGGAALPGWAVTHILYFDGLEARGRAARFASDTAHDSGNLADSIVRLSVARAQHRCASDGDLCATFADLAAAWQLTER